MRWNPIINALVAVLYIRGVGTFINYMSSIRHDIPDTIADSVTAISLVTFSAAVMGFLFFYRPIMLLIEQKKKEAVIFFLKTLGIFGVVTVMMVLLVL